MPDEDDDDLEVWIVQAEKPGEENDKEKVVDISSLDDDELEDDGDELAFLNAIDNSTNNAENVRQINEAFEDVDYYEDPEYEPEENDDNDSCKSIEISRPRRRIGQGKYKCDTCKCVSLHLFYSIAFFYIIHKLYLLFNFSEKDILLSCVSSNISVVLET